MVMLEKNARAIATDSGGVQKEAFFYRVPCLTLREETEWVELVDLGWNRIIPPNVGEIVFAIEKLIGQLNVVNNDISGNDIFGDGMAAEKIKSCLKLMR